MKTYEMNPCESELIGQKLHFVDIEQQPFSITGFGWYSRERRFCRLPQYILSDDSVNECARSLGWLTSGGMLRFKTTSPSPAIKADYVYKTYIGNMSVSGLSGFDIYLGRGTGKKYHSTAIPSLNFGKGIGKEQAFKLDSQVTELDYKLEKVIFNGMTSPAVHEVTINFPLFDGVENVRIGVVPGSEILSPSPFKHSKPIDFYGSSITQGGFASRPGNAYTNILGRRLDAPVLNFGFSGSGTGEAALARAIAELEMSAFVLDYDWNAPTPEHLEQTHGQFFRIIRKAHAQLPIILMSRHCARDDDARTVVIRKTYDKALAAGDKNVYFIRGRELFGKKHRNDCTVDRVHPNDLGFMEMADRIYPVLKKSLERHNGW